MSIMPLPAPEGGRGLDAGPLAYVLEMTEPDLFAAGLLDGESFADAAARSAARADIVDELLAEFAAEFGGAR
jgi:hypothetical protein